MAFQTTTLHFQIRDALLKHGLQLRCLRCIMHFRTPDKERNLGRGKQLQMRSAGVLFRGTIEMNFFLVSAHSKYSGTEVWFGWFKSNLRIPENANKDYLSAHKLANKQIGAGIVNFVVEKPMLTHLFLIWKYKGRFSFWIQINGI